MNEKTITLVLRTISSIASTLVLGELLGGVVSRPIREWRRKDNVNLEAVAELIDVMNQRICDLEEKGKRPNRSLSFCEYITYPIMKGCGNND